MFCRYSSPGSDLLYFLFCTTSREFRKEQSENLFMIYYETLSDSLKKAQIDVTKIFPWNHFVESIQEITLSCMISAFTIISISLLGSDASTQRIQGSSSTSNIVIDEFNKVDQYKNRMLDNLLDLLENLLD